MTHNAMLRRRILVGVLAVVIGVAMAGSALAAHPKAGKSYTGFTSGPAANGFKPPVSFRVSKTGTQVLGFKYSGRCDGIGGFGGPGSPWANPYFVIKIGTIKVDRKGHFSIKNAKWKAAVPGANPPATKYSSSSVSGRFKTSRRATGTIKLTQRESGHQATCTYTFTAATR